MTDDNWGEVISEITLAPFLKEEALFGIEEFSHLEILFHFHKADPLKIVTGAEHPRENPEWPRVGIFAQRKKSRPNLLGTTIVQFLKREGTTLFVKGLDADDGTPILDIKPVLKEFLPRGEVRQPVWASEVMRNYW
jgi:tRNA-Thr(GGU) m(6)t(6)A37 methyltransferase TsaA